jgi:superfamily II DNA or RNA helicase
MRLSLPFVLAIDELVNQNPIQRIAVPAQEAEGVLSVFTRDRIKGWLFQPHDGQSVLVVPPKTKSGRIPATYTHVLTGTVADVAADAIDLSSASWARHPQLADGRARDHAQEHLAIRASWRGGFSYVEENEAANVVGLRPPQIGAVHAIHAHWTITDDTATIVMPTGIGKTETMLSILVSACCHRVLVIVPTDALRSQLARKFLTLGVLKHPKSRILGDGVLYPSVCILRHIPTTPAEVEQLFARSNVIVTTSSIAGQAKVEVQRAMAAQCSHLFIDEAHHAEARTWSEFKERFSERRVLQFTATPFREDGRPLDGKTVFVYPLKKAQAEGYFKPIRFLSVIEFDPNRADEAIAARAVEQLRADYDKGHIVMARVATTARAEKVFKLYEQFGEFNPVQLHTGIKSTRAREEARRKILSKEARIVVCVDMLGEGFDLPELKIAAFHDIRKTLAVTLQLAGRFTRSRGDLGNATFIANTADVTVQEELRKLYTRDPDWNVLLPQLSDRMIGEQQSLQEFLSGFTKFADEIPLKTVRPALSTVAYRTTCPDWTPADIRRGIPNVGSCDQVYVSVNEKEHTAVVVTARRTPLAWSDVENVFSWQWELYVLFWWAEKKLLFVNGSTNASEFKSLGQAVAGQDVVLIRGQQVFRTFAGVTRLRLNNVGLSEQLGRNISFTSHMGSDAASEISDAQRRKAMKSVLAGSGYEAGESATVGASRKGRIWTHRRDRVDQLVAWCRHVGVKLLDVTIDPDVVLGGTLETEIVTARPEGMPVSIDWPEEIYASVETPWSVSIDDAVVHISECELELIDPTLLGPIRFAVAAETVKAEFELEIFEVAETSDFRVVVRDAKRVRIIRAETAIDASEYFTENPPRVWFADGASLDGNEHTPLKTTLPPYSLEKLAADWDWAGIDLRKESQGEAKAQDSIQAAVINRLKSGSYHLIFDDDDAGEAADVVAVTIDGPFGAPKQIDVEFYHCKFSRKSTAGGRVDDLYVVCGQAQTSIRWMRTSEKRTDIFTHLLRREDKRKAKGAPSRIERGDIALIETLRQMSYTTRVTLKIIVVQPGVSKASITESQLRLLSVTENYLLETHRLPFKAVISR